MKSLILRGIGIILLLCVNHARATLPHEWTVYTCMNGDFGKLNLATGYATKGLCPPGFWHLDFAPDGTLYGLSRSTDTLYRITNPETGQIEVLSSLPGNSGGDPIAVSPDGNYIYFTVGIGANPRTLYEYDLDTNCLTTLGVIQAPKAFTGMQFSSDGTLYAIDGGNSSNGTKRLWTIDLNSLVATPIGPECFGIKNMEVSGTAGALELAPDGTMYLLITPKGYSWPSNPHPTEYIGTIDLSTGLATINWNTPIKGFDHCDTIAIKPEPRIFPLACIADVNQPVEAQGAWGAKVTLDGSCSSDEDSTPGTNDDITEFNWYRYTADDSNEIFLGTDEILDCNLPIGTHQIILEVIDKSGAADSNEITITIEDTTAPKFNLIVLPKILWPANHKMVKVIPLWLAKDICDPKPKVSLVKITSNDKGMTKDDILIKNDRTIYLRAEHSKFVKNRIYYLTYEAEDFSGNTTTRTASVIVPHDHRNFRDWWF